MTDTITLPREVIERAISALQGCYEVDSYPNDGSTQQDAALNELRYSLAHQAEQVPSVKTCKNCTFHYKDIDMKPCSNCERGDNISDNWIPMSTGQTALASPKGGV